MCWRREDDWMPHHHCYFLLLKRIPLGIAATSKLEIKNWEWESRGSLRGRRGISLNFFFSFLKRYRLNFGDSRTLSWNLLNSGMGIITTKVMTSVMNNVDPPRDGYTSPHKSIKLFPSRLHPRSKAFGAITADVVYPSGAAAAGWSFLGGEASAVSISYEIFKRSDAAEQVWKRREDFPACCLHIKKLPALRCIVRYIRNVDIYQPSKVHSMLCFIYQTLFIYDRYTTTSILM